MDVLGYEKLYECSNTGIIRSIDRVIKCKDGKTKHLKGRILRQSKSKNGYLMVALSSNGVVKSSNVHRIVCKSFLENIFEKSDVNHKDGNKSNNNISNLEWATSSENCVHAYDNGLTRNRRAVLEFDLNGAFIKEYESISEAARCKLVSVSSIFNACNGRSRMSSDSQWRFKGDNIEVKRIKKYSKGVSVVMTSKNGDQTVFDSIKEASEKTGAHKEGIFNVCNNKSKNAGGSSWRYLIPKNK